MPEPLYNPLVRLHGPAEYSNPGWYHEVDLPPAPGDPELPRPQDSAEAFYDSQGRDYAYRAIDFLRGEVGTFRAPEPGDVAWHWFLDLYYRVMRWDADISIYTTGGPLCAFTVNTNSSHAQGGPEYLFQFINNAINPLSGGFYSKELVTAPSIVGSRQTFDGREGFLPDSAPTGQGNESERDFVYTASSFLEIYDSGDNVVGTSLSMTINIAFYGSRLLRYPRVTPLDSYLPFEISITWDEIDSSAFLRGGGYVSNETLIVIPETADLEQNDPAEGFTVAFLTNKPNYGSADDSGGTFFTGYEFNYEIPDPPNTSMPTTSYGSYLGPYPLVFKPGNYSGGGFTDGYFEYKCPETNLPIFDRDTGRRTSSGKMPMKMRPPTS